MVDSSRSLGDSGVSMLRAIADCVYALRSTKGGALIVTGRSTLNVHGTVCLVACLLLVAHQLFLASHRAASGAWPELRRRRAAARQRSRECTLSITSRASQRHAQVPGLRRRAVAAHSCTSGSESLSTARDLIQLQNFIQASRFLSTNVDKRRAAATSR